MLNQWSSLKNFIESGLVEISNNLCEQRMKPIKLNRKNCQNIAYSEKKISRRVKFSSLPVSRQADFRRMSADEAPILNS